MMAAATASSNITSNPGRAASDDAIASNRQGSDEKQFGKSLAQCESKASKQEECSAVRANEEELNEQASADASGDGSAQPVSYSMQAMQQKPLADSQLSETTALKPQGAVTAIGAGEAKAQFTALNSASLQRESLSTVASELFDRSKMQVAQDSKMSAINDAALFRTASQELNFKAELAMNANNKVEIGQRLVAMLSDKITLQASSQANKATIRLDPPEMGKIDLTVTLDRDRLSVQINTSNPSVREAITQTVERLRAELTQENFLEVTVNIGNDDKADTSPGNDVQDDTLTHITSNLSAADEQVEESIQQQEIIARV